jgi:uncharacterized FlaG/YvyC family protein
MTGNVSLIGPVHSPPEDKKSAATPEAPATKPRSVESVSGPGQVLPVSELAKTLQKGPSGQQVAVVEPEEASPDAKAKEAQERVEQLARKFSEHLENLHEHGYLRELKLDYENLEGDQLMVKIVDARTDKTIRTIPPEDQVEFARRMEEFLGLIMDELA